MLCSLFAHHVVLLVPLGLVPLLDAEVVMRRVLGPQRRCAEGRVADEEDGRGVEAGGIAVRRQGGEDDAAGRGGEGKGCVSCMVG